MTHMTYSHKHHHLLSMHFSNGFFPAALVCKSVKMLSPFSRVCYNVPFKHCKGVDFHHFNPTPQEKTTVRQKNKRKEMHLSHTVLKGALFFPNNSWPKQVRKALSYAPRKKRSLWVLNVTAPLADLLVAVVELKIHRGGTSPLNHHVFEH